MKNEEQDGYFTRNLFSLQLQMKTLLDGAGGDSAGQLLDTLAEFRKSEQEVVLRVFQRALDKFKNSGVRLETQQDKELAEFEFVLYEELVDGITALASTTDCILPMQSEKKFSVVDGGKLPTRKKRANKTICLQEARRIRHSKSRDEGRTIN